MDLEIDHPAAFDCVGHYLFAERISFILMMILCIVYAVDDNQWLRWIGKKTEN